MQTVLAKHFAVVTVIILVLWLCANDVAAQSPGATVRVSVASDGTEGNAHSQSPSLSGNGRYVAFDSVASNLVPNDTNSGLDVFVHNLVTGQTERVSVASDGSESESVGGVLDAKRVAISPDGRYVAFSSPAGNLVPNDTNSSYDIFVHDRETGQTTRVSVASDGTQGNAWASGGIPSISSDGRHVAFYSGATNLVSGDTNGTVDIFVHDRQTGETTRVSVASDGSQSDGYSDDPAISADGRYVAFSSGASNLVAGDSNGKTDVFLHDRQTAQTTRVSLPLDEAHEASWYSSDKPAVSADGRYVAFHSTAITLVPGETAPICNPIDLEPNHIYLRDMNTGSISRVVHCGWSAPAMSADGRYVAYSAQLEIGWDDNGWPLIYSLVYVHDRVTGLSSLRSMATGSSETSHDPAIWSHSYSPSISADGKSVAFWSSSANLVANDNNGVSDIFVAGARAVQFTRDPLVFAENAGTAPITLTYYADPSAGNVSIIYSTADGSAVAPADYVAASGTLALVPGESKAIRVPLVNDGIVEVDEWFNVRMSGLGTPGRAVATILNDDGPRAAFDRSSWVAPEASGAVTVTVSLDQPAPLAAQVNYKTVDGTATAGQDYLTASGVLSFAPGETSKAFRVHLLEDWQTEPDETIILVLEAPRYAVLGTPMTTTLTIVEDGAPPLGFGVSINQGALFTNQVDVILTLGAVPGISHMMVSNDGGFYAALWEPYAWRRNWQISRYGSYVIARTVYVKFKDLTGTVSSVYQDDIILDVTAPTGSVQVVPGVSATTTAAAMSASSSAGMSDFGRAAAGGQHMVYLPTVARCYPPPAQGPANVTLRLTAQDDLSGVAQMIISNSPDFACASWEDYAATRRWYLPPQSDTVYVKFRDRAGNVSSAISGRLSR